MLCVCTPQFYWYLAICKQKEVLDLVQKLLVWFWSLLYMVLLNVGLVQGTLEIG